MLLQLLFLFSIGSLLGWCLELFYRRFVSQKKWMNPGFLTGPCLPLYGSSLCVLYLMTGIEPYIKFENQILCKIVLFVCMALAITAIEYVAGLIFIKGMHIKLWDYSDQKFNVKGIICPLYTFYWLLLSGAYYFLINPHILKALIWLSENLTFSFFIGFFYGVFVLDLSYSLKLSVKIRKFASENKIIIRLDEIKDDITRHVEESKSKKHFFFSPFHVDSFNAVFEKHHNFHFTKENVHIPWKEWKENFQKILDENRKV